MVPTGSMQRGRLDGSGWSSPATYGPTTSGERWPRSGPGASTPLGPRGRRRCEGSGQGARVREGGAGRDRAVRHPAHIAGLYGDYGGRYVPETLIPALDELERGWLEAAQDTKFIVELEALGRTYAGRPTPL